MERGCRQGDPWSPYIFILAIEPLAQYIKYQQAITGIKIGNHEIKIGQYADDTFLTIDGSRKSIRTIIHSLTLFRQVSVLAINVDKTQVVKLGNQFQPHNCPILNIPFCTKFKLLGIHFSTNINEMEELNFRPKIAKMQKVIKLYEWRNLTLAGKITVVKMHILPNFVHILAVLPSPKREIINEIQSILSRFIWNNKRPKINFNTLI